MAQHQSHWCRWCSDRTTEISNQSGSSINLTVSDHHRSSIFSDSTANTVRQNGVFGYWTSDICCDTSSLAIGPPTPVASVANLAIKPPVLIADEEFLPSDCHYQLPE